MDYFSCHLSTISARCLEEQALLTPKAVLDSDPVAFRLRGGGDDLLSTTDSSDDSLDLSSSSDLTSDEDVWSTPRLDTNDDDYGADGMTPPVSPSETVTDNFPASNEDSISSLLFQAPCSPRQEYTSQWLCEQLHQSSTDDEPLTFEQKTPQITPVPDSMSPIIAEELSLSTEEPQSPASHSEYLDLSPSDPCYLDTSRAVLECDIEDVLMNTEIEDFRGLSYPIDLHPDGSLDRTNAWAMEARMLRQCPHPLPIFDRSGARGRRPRLTHRDSLYANLLDQRLRRKLREQQRLIPAKTSGRGRASISPPRSLMRYPETDEDEMEN